MTSPSWQVLEYRGRPGLEQLEADWKRIYAGMPTRSRCHVYEAHLAYLDHLCESPALSRYLALTDGKRVRAICPLEARKDLSLGLPVPVWSLPWDLHWFISTDVLCQDDEARLSLVPTLVRHLRQTSEGRPLLVLGPLPEESALWQGLRGLGSSRSCSHVGTPSCCFDCEMPYDELMSRATKHFRRNVRNHRTKLSRLDGVRITSVSGQPGIAAELDAFMAVEASGWKGEGGTGSAIRLQPRLAAFYRDVAGTMLGHEDHCEINSLYVDGRCVASQFCIRTGGDYAILKIGYDEAYARLGPGQVLLDRTLERCCSDPTIKRLDLIADSPWCRDWQPSKMPMQQAHVGIGGWSGRALVVVLDFRYGLGSRIVHRVRGISHRRANGAAR